ncbi:hypothetical protein GOP47_0001410 [Adiantum capillus-veneris]|uniref:NB-ARC domain-containing protein n=1 Tax=Adiantum capillus-veneris TaxID=13818 RepID=A0A9D4ZPZ8_ADICA|nr:hypothetical protein GOP47_0001410 [Adiantum capillus-veneris]
MFPPLQPYRVDDAIQGMDRMIQQAMDALEDGVQRHKVFLALDNVWDVEIGGVHVIKIVASIIQKMAHKPGSKVIVTSRSRLQLERMLEIILGSYPKVLTAQNVADFIVHVPSMNEDDAKKALLYHSSLSIHMLPSPCHLDRLVRSCFIENRSYPLFVRVRGAELRELARVLQRSFDKLTPQLQVRFSDLVTCWWKRDSSSSRQCNKWLEMVYDGNPTAAQLRRQILELEYHDAPFNHVYQVSPLSVLPPRPQLATYKYVYGEFDKKSLTELLATCPPRNLQVLWLLHSNYTPKESIKCYVGHGVNLKSLRILRIQHSNVIEELGGSQGVRNLVSLGLRYLGHLKRIGDIGCLKKLESLKVVHCEQLQVQALVSNSVAAHWRAKLQKSVTTWLVKADLTYCGELTGNVEVGSSVRILRLAGCAKLERMEGSTCPLTALEELDLVDNSVIIKLHEAAVSRSLQDLRLDFHGSTSNIGTSDGGDDTNIVWLQ